jgi:hypothetical protein
MIVLTLMWMGRDSGKMFNFPILDISSPRTDSHSLIFRHAVNILPYRRSWNNLA